SEGGREILTRCEIIDHAIAAAQRERRSSITDMDVLRAVLAAHDDAFPAIENAQWTDKRLQTGYNALYHFLGHFDESLNVRLSEVRYELGFSEISPSLLNPVEHAPVAARSAVLALLADHPTYHRNCFLMMSFAASRTHEELTRVTRDGMRALGFNVLRAD